MVIIKSQQLKQWLKLTGHDQNWLADKLNISNGYVSQTMNGGEVSGELISSLLTLTHFKFEKLFEIALNGDNPNHPRHNYEKFRKRKD